MGPGRGDAQQQPPPAADSRSRMTCSSHIVKAENIRFDEDAGNEGLDVSACSEELKNYFGIVHQGRVQKDKATSVMFDSESSPRQSPRRRPEPRRPPKTEEAAEETAAEAETEQSPRPRRAQRPRRQRTARMRPRKKTEAKPKTTRKKAAPRLRTRLNNYPGYRICSLGR